jgi:glycosyltransferase involved in cell wall biosynthesis
MPVFNSGRHLPAAVAALQAQTFTDFELIISDNASTDDTPALATALAAADPRIRYFRNDSNVGVFRNYDLAFARARGRYFRWASGSDLCEPGHLAACVAMLERDPAVALAYPRTLLLTDTTAQAVLYADDPDIRDPDPVVRLRRVLAEIRLNNAFNGVYRAAWLRESGLNGEYLGSDYVVVAEMALRGYIARLDEPLFYRRMTPEAASAVQDPVTRRQFFAGTRRDVHGTPHLDRQRALLQAVLQAPLRPGARLRALALLMRRWWWARRELLAEIRQAVQQSS